MVDVIEVSRKHWTGPDADKANIPSPVVGTTYSATDTGKDYYWNGTAWKRGLLESMIDHTWEGDDANNREIDLGDDYDFILIFQEESKASTVDHGPLAHAFRACYGAFNNNGAANLIRHSAMAAADGSFQGKMTGGDSTKIKLGSTGNTPQGWNFLNQTYRLIGFKFLDMV